VNLFTCEHCGQRVYFENVRCEHCKRALGYWPQTNEMFALTSNEDDTWTSEAGTQLRYCTNVAYAACNWLIEPHAEADSQQLCQACAFNRTIPDIAVEKNRERWQQLELAKHRLIYSLRRLNLPLDNGHEEPGGLLFDFLAGHAESGQEGPVITGHADGVITVDVSEADAAVRTERRQQLGERFRTLLGHFRHEIGHFYFPRLVTGERLEAFHGQFGDETLDYSAALDTYYKNGPVPDWTERFVSAYASSHPHEDWAETFAHYIHIVDTLDSARAFGIGLRPLSKETRHEQPASFDSYREGDFERIWSAWLPLTLAVNELNRSVGNDDLYPFVVTPIAIDKLRFVHAAIKRSDDAPSASQSQGDARQGQRQG